MMTSRTVGNWHISKYSHFKIKLNYFIRCGNTLVFLFIRSCMQLLLFIIFDPIGCQPISSLQFLSPACYGNLKNLQIQRFATKRFFHLIPNDPVVCSFILCNRNETAWDELKVGIISKCLPGCTKNSGAGILKLDSFDLLFPGADRGLHSCNPVEVYIKWKS